MSALSLRHIEIFQAVMTTGNLTEAAALLHTSQPTVSRELARCEALLQLRLFDRIRGRLYPTSEGLRLFEEVQRSFYGLDRIRNAAHAIRQFKQTQLSLVCLPMFSQSLLPRVCQQLFTRFPEINLTLTPQESPLLEEWLTAQRFDLGLTERASTPAGTRQQTLLTINEVCVLPLHHPLARRAQLNAEDFAEQNFISLSATDSYRQWLDSLFQQQQIPRKLVVETHSAASVCALVAHGVGISVVNPLTALDFADQLVILPFAHPLPFTVSLIQPLHRPSSRLVEEMKSLLEQEVQKIPPRLQAVLG